jgi:hypothetical protein
MNFTSRFSFLKYPNASATKRGAKFALTTFEATLIEAGAYSVDEPPEAAVEDVDEEPQPEATIATLRMPARTAKGLARRADQDLVRIGPPPITGPAPSGPATLLVRGPAARDPIRDPVRKSTDWSDGSPA